MLALVDTHRIEAVVAMENKWVCNREYLELNAMLAEQKLTVSRSRFEALRVAIDKAFQ